MGLTPDHVRVLQLRALRRAAMRVDLERDAPDDIGAVCRLTLRAYQQAFPQIQESGASPTANLVAPVPNSPFPPR